MLDLIITLVFFWLFFKVLKLVFKMTWGIAKFAVSLLFSIAVPMLLGCLFFAGGLLILVPLGLIGLAFGIVKHCI
jgi:hypothetical protein